ncbi:beta-galactosidase [Sesbania bispinosa]|nr:beta-galactosidase [Sesbania bispinosa]
MHKEIIKATNVSSHDVENVCPKKAMSSNETSGVQVKEASDARLGIFVEHVANQTYHVEEFFIEYGVDNFIGPGPSNTVEGRGKSQRLKMVLNLKSQIKFKSIKQATQQRNLEHSSSYIEEGFQSVSHGNVHHKGQLKQMESGEGLEVFHQKPPENELSNNELSGCVGVVSMKNI